MNMLKSIFIAFALTACASHSALTQSAYPEGFSQAEIDQMLAPIALYPDSVLSHVLIAATYPLEVVQAARWSRHNPGLKGEAAVAAVERMNWDPSVQALVAFPELLRRMDEDLDWTQRLGDAFLMQEELVLDSIQHLRSEAYASGHLRSNDHVRVVRETRYIYIEPVRTRTVYVPYYDPRVVWVDWRWSSYPPVYWHHPRGYSPRVAFYWGSGYHVAPSFYFSAFHWSNRRVVSVHNYHIHHHHHHNNRQRHFTSGRDIARYDGARHWKHNPVHRRGVSYRQGVNEARFAQVSQQQATRNATNRATASRPAQVRNEQRSWATERRASLQSGELATRQGSQGRSAVQRTPERGAVERNSARNTVERNSSTRSAVEQRATSREAAQRSRSTTAERSSERAPAAARIQERTTGRESSQREITPRTRTTAPARDRSGAVPTTGTRSQSRPEVSRIRDSAAVQRPSRAVERPSSSATRSAPARQIERSQQRPSTAGRIHETQRSNSRPSVTQREPARVSSPARTAAPSPRASAPSRQAPAAAQRPSGNSHAPATTRQRAERSGSRNDQRSSPERSRSSNRRNRID